MNEETEPTENEAVESEKEETLEDIYKELNIEDEAKDFSAQPAQPVQPVEADPYDDDIRQELKDLKTELTSIKESSQKSQIEADINSAVDFVSNKVEGVKPRVIEALLEAQAAEDPKFKQLWESRKANPKAWERALDVFSKGVANDFSVKQDPQLTENLRAASQSQSAMTTNEKRPNEDWDGVDDDEFQHKWSGLLRG